MSCLSSNSRKFGSKKILIVDDDIDLRETFDLALRQEDYAVISAKDGAEAMEILEGLEKEELPDLILLDYQMPRMNGMVFSRIKAQHVNLSPIPVVLLSAAGNKREIQEKTVADAYVEKPLDLKKLLDIAHHFIHRVDAAKFSFLA